MDQSNTRIHPSAVLHRNSLVEEGATVGARTRVGAFVHVLSSAVIGEECNIADGVFVDDRVVIGDRVTIEPGARLCSGVTLEDGVIVGPNAAFATGRELSAANGSAKHHVTTVRAGTSVGANAAVLAGVTLGRHVVVAPGAVITHDVPANAIVMGNPAYIEGYVGTDLVVLRPITGRPPGSSQCRVKGVRLVELPEIRDLRGSLSFAEVGGLLPFQPKRFFLVHGVPSREVRGEHAHKTLHQFLVCAYGECSLIVDDGENREEIVLNTPTLGVHLEPLVWGVQFRFSIDAVLLVFASECYDPTDYIRDYDHFLAVLGPTR